MLSPWFILWLVASLGCICYGVCGSAQRMGRVNTAIILAIVFALFAGISAGLAQAGPMMGVGTFMGGGAGTGGPPASGFAILTEGGNNLATEGGDILVTEAAP